MGFQYSFRRRVCGALHAGLVWNLRATTHIEETGFVDEDGNDEVEDAPAFVPPNGFRRHVNHGARAELLVDTRDDFHFPRNGGIHRTYLSFYGGAIGGDYDYVHWVVDSRQYFSTFKDQVLALQLFHEHRNGDAPFSSMSELGGPYMMRGYFKGRYRDNNMTALQAEYRFPLIWRFSGVGFGNVGQVYGEERFRMNRTRWTLGGGLRFLVGSRTYVRVDVGGNHETTAIVFNGGQTFWSSWARFNTP